MDDFKTEPANQYYNILLMMADSFEPVNSTVTGPPSPAGVPGAGASMRTLIILSPPDGSFTLPPGFRGD